MAGLTRPAGRGVRGDYAGALGARILNEALQFFAPLGHGGRLAGLAFRSRHAANHADAEHARQEPRERDEGGAVDGNPEYRHRASHQYRGLRRALQRLRGGRDVCL